jgi:hypothetical protein
MSDPQTQSEEYLLMEFTLENHQYDPHKGLPSLVCDHRHLQRSRTQEPTRRHRAANAIEASVKGWGADWVYLQRAPGRESAQLQYGQKCFATRSTMRIS